MTTFYLEIDSGHAAITPHTIQVFKDGSAIGTATATVITPGLATMVTADITLSLAEPSLVTVSAYNGNGEITSQERYIVNEAGAIQDGNISTLLSEIKNLEEADQILVLSGSTYVLKTYQRGTTTELIPEKTAKTPEGANLTNPIEEELAGYTTE